MTDELIERIKADRILGTTDEDWTSAEADARRLVRIPEMEARIIADAKIIKAADELADASNAACDDNDVGNWSQYKYAEMRSKLAAYRAAIVKDAYAEEMGE